MLAQVIHHRVFYSYSGIFMSECSPSLAELVCGKLPAQHSQVLQEGSPHSLIPFLPLLCLDKLLFSSGLSEFVSRISIVIGVASFGGHIAEVFKIFFLPSLIQK